MNTGKKLKILVLVSLLLLLIALPVAADTVIVHTNDVHGRLDTNAGYDGLVAYMNDLKEAGDTVLLFDAGDPFQGLIDVNYYKGASAADIMNKVGYLAMAPGNHDFDFGVANLVSLSKTLNFPILCINVLNKETGKLLFETSKVIETPNMKIGVFGILTPNTSTTTSDLEGMKKLTFLEKEDLYNAAQKEVDNLKKQGCTFIICLSHLGLSENDEPNRSSDLASHVNGIDLIIDGHSHTVLQEGMTVNSTLIVSTGENLVNIGVVRITNGKPVASLVSYKDYTKKDEEITNLIHKYTDELNEKLSEVIGETAYDLNGERNYCRTQETNLGDLLTDSFMSYQSNRGMNADCALVNGGSIRQSIPKGDITLKTVNSVQPFGNSLYLIKTSGKNILKAIEDNTATVPEPEGGFPQVSGIEYTLNITKEYVSGEINRVTITSINGKPFDENKIYTVATTDFVSNGGDKYSAFVNSEYVDLGITTDSVLAGYIRNSLGGKVGEKYAKPQGRITIISSSSNSSSSSESTTNTTSASAKSPVPIIGIAAGLVASILLSANRFNKSRR